MPFGDPLGQVVEDDGPRGIAGDPLEYGRERQATRSLTSAPWMPVNWRGS
jgi:hypothetical protein